MRKLQLALLLTFATLVLLIITVFSAPTFINWQNNKGFIENLASDFLGHRVKINGDLQVQLLPNPKIYAENILIDSVSGDDEIASIEHVIITKKLSEIFVLDWTIDTIVINRAKIKLVEDATGSKNWEPLKLKNSNYYSRKLKNSVNGLVNFQNINIENATVNYLNEEDESESSISQIYLTFVNNSSKINVKGSAEYKGIEQKIKTTLDIENAKSIKVNSTLSNQEYMISLQGIVTNPYNLSRSQFVGKFKSEFEDGNKVKFNETFSSVSKKYFDLKQLKLSSEITASKNKFSMSMIDLSSKFNKLKGNVSYSKKSGDTDISLKLDIDKIYIKKEESAKSKEKIEWSEDPLDFSLVNNLRLTTSIDCIECTYGNKTFYQVSLKSSLENNNLVISQFNLKSSDTGFVKLSATAGLNSPIAFETKLEASKFPLDTLMTGLLSKKAKLNLNGGANFSSSGVSQKAMFANLTGSFDIDITDLELEKIDDSSVKAMIDGLLFNKNRVNFNSKIGNIKLSGGIRDGVLRNSETSFILSGEKITAKGKFDLANLAANYRIEPVELRRNNLGVVISGNINDLEIISDKITPKGVVDGFNRVVTTKIIKKAKRKEVRTPFDFSDADNLEANVKNYLFEK